MLIVINDQTTDVSNIPDNIKYAGSKVQLLVYNNHCSNDILIEKLKKISTIWIDNSTPFIKTFSECVNELLRLCQADYICVSREDALYSENWLKKLIETYNLIESSGIISINDLSTNEGNYQLTKYNTLEWVYCNEFRINNFAFFKTDLIYKIGGFNPEINGVFSFWDICDRARLKGYYNYFVPDTNLIKQNLYFDHFTEPSFSQFQSRKFTEFIKIFNFSPPDENNLEQLSLKLGSLFSYNDKLGCIVFIKKNELSLQTISTLANELKALKLQMDLYCSSYFENDILKMSFIGLIRPIK
jgi:hypothetical protein